MVKINLKKIYEQFEYYQKSFLRAVHKAFESFLNFRSVMAFF